MRPHYCLIFGKLYTIFSLCMLLNLPSLRSHAETFSLPLAATPWTFWALLENKGGIGYSYADKSIFYLSESRYEREKNRKVKAYSDNLEVLKKIYLDMTSKELNNLSPLEKLALISGAGLYELEKHLKDDQRYFAEDWGGNCDGVAIAGLTFPEPRVPLTIDIPNQKKSIVFSVADQKSILALYARYLKYQTYNFTFNPDEPDTPLFEPHVLLETLKQQMSQLKSVVIDFSVGPEEWNAPVISFSDQLINTTVVNNIKMDTIELNIIVAFATTKTILTQPNLLNQKLVYQRNPNFVKKLKVRYIMETNPNGKVKSSWDSKFYEQRIDYMFVPDKKLNLIDIGGDEILLKSALVKIVGQLPGGM